MVHDAGTGDITLEHGDVAFQGQGELPIFLSHMLGRKPGDSISGSVLVLECCLELPKEVIPGSEGYSSASDCIFSESVSPG